jgi:hypothetical protein
LDKDEKMQWRHPANIVIEGDEPEPEPPPQLPPTLPPQPEAKPSDGKQQQPTKTERALTAQILRRLITRMARAVENGKTDLTEHRDIIRDNLSVWDNAEQFTDALIDLYQTELNAVLPEQRAAVFARHDVDKLVEELWT